MTKKRDLHPEGKKESEFFKVTLRENRTHVPLVGDVSALSTGSQTPLLELSITITKGGDAKDVR